MLIGTRRALIKEKAIVSPSSLTWHNPGGTNFGLYTGNPTGTQTISSINFGTASADRVIVVAFSIIGNGHSSGDHLTGVTLGGVTATSAVEGYYASGGREFSIWYANVPTGTSGSVSFSATTNGDLNTGQFALGYLTGSATASVASTVTSAMYPIVENNGASFNATASVTIGTGQVAVICGGGDGSGSTPGYVSAFNNATKDQDVVSSNFFWGGTLAHATTSATVGMEITNTGIGNFGWIAAVFKP